MIQLILEFNHLSKVEPSLLGGLWLPGWIFVPTAFTLSESWLRKLYSPSVSAFLFLLSVSNVLLLLESLDLM